MPRHLGLTRALAGLVAAGLLLTGCGSGNSGDAAAPADAEIEIGSLYEPSNLSNVDAGGQGVTEALSQNVYESLIRLNDDGSLSNLLAEDYQTSDDGLTYTFTLRDGVKFHSGRELTAADVKASFERVVAESSQAARKSSFKVVKDVTAKDDRTVVFTLSERSISFPYLLANVWIVSPELKDPKTDADGTGPYEFDDWRRGSTLSLKRFDGYWGEKAKNARATFHYYTEASAESNALLTGEIDIITSVQSPETLAQFEGNEDFTISEGTSTTKEVLAFNDRVAPFDDAKVRRAVYSAVNREKLLDAIWDGRGKLIGSMVPPTDPWYEDLTNVNPYDPELAKKLLAESGHPDGFSFTLLTPNYDPHPQVAEFLRTELAKVGIKVEIKTITADEWYTNVFQKKDFQATLQEHVNDRDVVWYGNPDFYWGYDNAEVQKLVLEAEQAATPEEQAAKLKEANKIIATEAASNWLYLYPQIVVAAKDIQGYWVNGLNSQFPVAGITKG